MMKRTQIYFPKELHKDLKIGAAIMKIGLSEYIRMILEEKLYFKPIRKKTVVKKKTRLSLLAENAIDLGPRDLARNFDKYFEESLK